MRLVLPLLALASLSAAVGSAAPAPLPRPERRAPAADLTGQWEFVSWKSFGREIPNTQRIEITPGKTVYLQIADPNNRVTYDLRLHPHLSPPAYEWHNAGEHYVGCYRLEGPDRLVMIYKPGRNLEGRPREFNGSADNHIVLRRTGR
jgi:uncharacterized protein (TIGR03067 family)